MADVPGLLEVFHRAVEDLDERRGRRPQPRNPRPLEQLFRHFMATDPGGAIVADDRGRVVAFGMATSREGHWFQSFLFVVPEWQGRGLGRAILETCSRHGGAALKHATCAEADQVVSTGLYASAGLTPRLPIYLLRGELDPAALPGLPEAIRARPLGDTDLGELDVSLLGYRRPQDHEFWVRTERRGWAFETRAGDLVGYGYAQPSGRMGPVASLQAESVLPFVGHLARSVTVRDGWQLVVPGPARSALSGLLRGGLRIDQTPAIYCADAAAPGFERYLPASFALL